MSEIAVEDEIECARHYIQRDDVSVFLDTRKIDYLLVLATSHFRFTNFGKTKIFRKP